MTEGQEWYQQVYLKSIRWKALRAWRMKKDGYQCVRCGSLEDLHVHHKTYDNRGHDFDLEFNDCETLCEECHQGEHDESIRTATTTHPIPTTTKATRG